MLKMGAVHLLGAHASFQLQNSPSLASMTSVKAAIHLAECKAVGLMSPSLYL